MSDAEFADVEAVVHTIAETAVANEKYFGDLDAVVGDGDFGYSMARGFELVLEGWDGFDRTDIGLDLLDAGGARVKRGNVPLVDGNPGFGLKFLRGFVVAGVSGRDIVAGCLQRFGNRRADASGSTRHHCDAGHYCLPLFVTAGLVPAICLFVRRLKSWMPGTRPSMTIYGYLLPVF